MKTDFLQPYLQKKKYNVFPALLLLFASILFFVVVLPQLSEVGNYQSQISDRKNHIGTLQKSLSTLTSQNSQQLDTDYLAATTALPNTKNIIGIYSSLTSAAVDANVLIKSFTLSVGDVYNSNGKLSPSTTTSVHGVPYLMASVQVQGASSVQIVNFVDNIYKRLPLAEVKTIQGGQDQSSIEVNFFYKPYNVDQIANDENISPLDAASQKTLSQIKQMSQ